MYEHAPIEKSMGLDDSASRSLTGKRAQAPELFGVKGNHKKTSILQSNVQCYAQLER